MEAEDGGSEEGEEETEGDCGGLCCTSLGRRPRKTLDGLTAHPGLPGRKELLHDDPVDFTETEGSQMAEVTITPVISLFAS